MVWLCHIWNLRKNVWETAIKVKPFQVNFDWQICRETTCVLRWVEHAQSLTCDTLQNLQTWEVFLLKIFSSYRSCWNNWNRFEKEKALKTLIAWKEFKKEVFEVNNPFEKAPQWRLKFWWVFLFNLLFDGAFFCWLLCNSSVLCLLFATVNNSGVMLVNPFLVFPFFLEIFANVTEMATSFPQNDKGCNFGEAASCLAKFCQIVHWLQMTKSVTTQIMA